MAADARSSSIGEGNASLGANPLYDAPPDMTGSTLPVWAQGSFQYSMQLAREASQLLDSASPTTPSVSDSMVSSAILEMLRTRSAPQAVADQGRAVQSPLYDASPDVTGSSLPVWAQASFQYSLQLAREASAGMQSASASTPSLSDGMVSSAILEMLGTGSTPQPADQEQPEQALDESEPAQLQPSAAEAEIQMRVGWSSIVLHACFLAVCWLVHRNARHPLQLGCGVSMTVNKLPVELHPDMASRSVHICWTATMLHQMRLMCAGH